MHSDTDVSYAGQFEPADTLAGASNVSHLHACFIYPLHGYCQKGQQNKYLCFAFISCVMFFFQIGLIQSWFFFQILIGLLILRIAFVCFCI